MIGIDARPLQDPIARGVSSYARPLIEEMIRQRGADGFRFFATGRTPHPTLSPLGARGENILGKTSHRASAARDSAAAPRGFASAIDEGSVNVKRLNLPSKLVNLGMRAFGSPAIDGFLGVRSVFMPNLNFWSVTEGARLVVTAHDLSFMVNPAWFTPKERLWHKLIGYRTLLGRADAIITLSGHAKRELIELLNIPEEKIFHIGPGIPPVAPADPALVPEYPYLLFLGAIEPRKNLEIALAAFELLAKKEKDIHFILAGPKAYGLASASERVHFLGQVSPERKGALLRGARALFMPSLYEGFGFPPLEAMSAGVPVVASSAGALPETVEDAGILLDPRDTGAFAEALHEICRDGGLRAMFIDRGLRRAMDFSWEKCAAETMNVIRG